MDQSEDHIFSLAVLTAKLFIISQIRYFVCNKHEHFHQHTKNNLFGRVAAYYQRGLVGLLFPYAGVLHWHALPKEMGVPLGIHGLLERRVFQNETPNVMLVNGEIYMFRRNMYLDWARWSSILTKTSLWIISSCPSTFHQVFSKLHLSSLLFNLFNRNPTFQSWSLPIN